MIIIDANIWIAAHVDREPQHEVCKRWLRETITEGGAIAAPLFFILEIAAGLERRGNEQYREAVERDIREAFVELYPVDADFVHLAVERCSELRLRTLDAMYAALAEQLDATLYTWDDDIHKRAGHRIRVRYPA